MPSIHNEASTTRFWLGLAIAAALTLVLAVVAANIEHTGAATDAMSMVGPWGARSDLLDQHSANRDASMQLSRRAPGSTKPRIITWPQWGSGSRNGREPNEQIFQKGTFDSAWNGAFVARSWGRPSSWKRSASPIGRRSSTGEHQAGARVEGAAGWLSWRVAWLAALTTAREELLPVGQ
jgi:hypothetical protein